MTALEISRLTPQERLELIAALWDSLETGQVPLAPAQEAELARRMATFAQDARDATDWDVVEAELDARAR